MADAHFYHAKTFSNTDPERTWQILKEIADFIDTTVSLTTGWETLDYTNKDFGAFDVQYEIVSPKTDWDPLAEVFNEGYGDAFASLPGTDSSQSRSIYLRFSEGAGDNHNINSFDYYLTTIDIEGSGNPAYFDIRCGALIHPWVKVFRAGTSPFVPAYTQTNGWGNPPSDPVPLYQSPTELGLYDSFPPVGSHTLPDAPNTVTNPWGFNSQPGYVAGSETITNFLGYGTEPNLTAHYFVGVESGAPYLYIVMETESIRPDGVNYNKYYAHLGVGNIIKSGTWKGGQFVVGHNTDGNVSRIDSTGSDYHTRGFDSHSTRYAGGRCSFYFSLDMAPYDPAPEPDPLNVPLRFLFGYTSNGYKQYCFGNSLTGLVSQMKTDSYNVFNGRSVMFPQHIKVLDQIDNSWYYLAGIAPATRTLEIDRINPGAVILEDGVPWIIFPIRSKQSGNLNVPLSDFYGYAYRIPIDQYLYGAAAGSASVTAALEVI